MSFTSLPLALNFLRHPMISSRRESMISAIGGLHFTPAWFKYADKPDTELNEIEKTQIIIPEVLQMLTLAIEHAVSVYPPFDLGALRANLDKIHRLSAELPPSRYEAGYTDFEDKLVEAIIDVEYELNTQANRMDMRAYVDNLLALIDQRAKEAWPLVHRLPTSYKYDFYFRVMTHVVIETEKRRRRVASGWDGAMADMMQLQLTLHALDKVLETIPRLPSATWHSSAQESLANATSLLRPQLSARTMGRYNI